MKLDILAIGVHPDDVELSCAGVLIAEGRKGKKAGILDLTQGELGTRGTAETRKQEAKDSAAILGIAVRENLSMADGFFKNDEEHQKKVITAIRRYKPEVLLCNAPEDRHPDHGRAAELVRDAAFLSGLMKIETKDGDSTQEPWRPRYVFNYIQDRFIKPDFIVDITEAFETKVEAIKAYKTQFFNLDSKEPQTYISSPEFLESVIYRMKMLGKMIGVTYAEGFISEKALGISSLDAFVMKAT